MLLTGLVGCLLIVGIIIFVVTVWLLWNMFLAKLILIVSMGLFHYSLVAQYWYIVLLLYVIQFILGVIVKIINVGK